MSINLNKITLTLVMSCFSVAVFAAPTVTFNGEITDQTCESSINGHTNSVVMLDPVAKADFGATLSNGQTAGLATFTIELKNCTTSEDALNVSTNFLGYDVVDGSLGNRAVENAAEGFGIQLTTDAAGTSPVHLNGITSVEGLNVAAGETTAKHAFGARYIVTDATVAKAGMITSVAEYTISYF